jgi:hypothetical protein
VPAYQSTQLCAIASEPDQFFKSAPNGGSRVLAVTSDGDTALQMLESTSDLIDAPMFVKASSDSVFGREAR